MATTATILHADLDAFYASVSIACPSLRGKSIAVGDGIVLPLLAKPRHLGSAAACPDAAIQ
jgi:DNA polymerase IV